MQLSLDTIVISLITIIGALMAVLTTIIVALIGFLFKREKGYGILEASQKAGHKRLDRLENKIFNGGLKK